MIRLSFVLFSFGFALVACGGDDDDGGSEKKTPSGSVGTVEVGGVCEVRWDCAAATADCVCEADDSPNGQTGRCRLIAVGAQCSISSDCPGMTCVGGTCRLYVKSGGACGPDVGICGAGFTCKDGTCSAAVPEGESCLEDEPAPCAAGLYCADASGTCVAEHLEGEPCDQPGLEACGPNGVCTSVGAAPKCYPRRESGESCVHQAQCPEGFTCDGRCKKEFELGDCY